MSQDVVEPPPLDVTGCGPGADRCVRARTAPGVIIRCERHFLAAWSQPWVSGVGFGRVSGALGAGEGTDLRSAV